MMLSMEFNVCQTFRDERANGTRILLHVRMHDVTCPFQIKNQFRVSSGQHKYLNNQLDETYTHGIFFGQRTLSLDRFLLLFAVQQRHGQIVSFAAQFRPVFVRYSILNHLNIAIMFQTAMALIFKKQNSISAKFHFSFSITTNRTNRTNRTKINKHTDILFLSYQHESVHQTEKLANEKETKRMEKRKKT